MEEEIMLNMVKQTLCDKKCASVPSIRLSSFHATFHKDFLSSVINGTDIGLEKRERERETGVMVFKNRSTNHALTAGSHVNLNPIMQFFEF